MGKQYEIRQLRHTPTEKTARRAYLSLVLIAVTTSRKAATDFLFHLFFSQIRQE